MPKHVTKTIPDRLFGLRLADHELQLAVAQRQSDGSYAIEIDEVDAGPSGWLTPEGVEALREAIAGFVHRWEMRRQTLAVSLDGRFCVTRVAMGPTALVDEELEAMVGRVQRYLSLGPGAKIVGRGREVLPQGIDYAVTAVANQNVVETIYATLRQYDLEPTWTEPALASIARLIGACGIGVQEPVLIADGSATQWEIGIAYQGRLLLDYRPAVARSATGLRSALLGHVERLHRFCDRHREVTAQGLKRLYLCGSQATVTEALAVFAEQRELEVAPLSIDPQPSQFRLGRQPCPVEHLSAVAAVFPLIEGTAANSIADLLCEVRRERELSLTAKLAWLAAPLGLAAATLLPIHWMTAQREARLASMTNDTARIEADLSRANQQVAELVKQRGFANQLAMVERQATEVPWSETLQRITRCLPPALTMEVIQWQRERRLKLVGRSSDETVIFDVIGHLRRLPEVEEVVLQGTGSMDEAGSIQFELLLQLHAPAAPPNPAGGDTPNVAATAAEVPYA